MATNDITSIYGGKLTNFMDLDGDSTIEDMMEALDLLEQDPRVKVIFLNMFAGVKNLNSVINGLIKAREFGLKKHMVIRLRGISGPYVRDTVN